MSLKKHEDGRRSIQVEVEVPGTPEQVWRAIATGPGISAWFTTVEVEERVGGAVRLDFGGGLESAGTVAEWEPPHRFLTEGRSFGPDGPPTAVEWSVEARGGDTCLVRVVHSLFASEDDWDDQLESIESGWPGFFRILRMYLSHYAGEPCTIARAMSPAPGTDAEAWAALAGALGLTGAAAGERWSTPDTGVPALAGTVDAVGDLSGFVHLEQPSPGCLMANAFAYGEQTMIGVGLYLYGAEAAAVAEVEGPKWQEWMGGHVSG